MAAAPDSSSASSSIYAQVDSYPWDTDAEFQSGLGAILGSTASSEQAVELALRARCFYYSRKFNTPVDFDAYKAYRASTPTPSAVPTTAPNGLAPQEAPYPTSFAHIVELITTGQPIPGIKEIPDTVLEGQGTAPVASKRKKPWEKDVGVAAASSSAEVPAASAASQ
ncbi:putative myb dna-binding domain protein [Diplodia seriata]|uniref:Putative myb dna-binding domain protein n=1 Tax=Diplodia seriata TaxID=420778 RepID=A0A0G2G769_9PEZI|nr:putative myb dna-binding domain protein [Diplodia seriata]